MNRRYIFAAVAVCLFLISPLAAAVAGEVNWAQPPYKNILERAKNENKHVFIDFYATWCGPCKQLEKVTYKDNAVAEFLNGIIPVKFDAEKGEGETLAKQFNVIAYPTLVLLDSNGEEVDRYIGFIDAAKFIEIIGGYAKGIGTVGFYEQKIEKNPDDIDALLKLGMKHADSVRPDEAKEALGRVLELDPDNQNKAEIWANLGYVMYSSGRNEAAAEYYDHLIKDFPDTDYHDQSLQMLARLYYRMEKRDESLEAYGKYVARHPDDPRAMNGFAWFCAKRKFGFDKALPVALKAVEISGRDAGVLDTLAELYFAMGDYENAIKTGEEALSKEPDDTYYQEQLVKYRKAAIENKEDN